MTIQGRLLHAVEPPPPQESRGKPHYSDVFKSSAVARVRSGQKIAQVARDLGIARNTLKAWMGDPDTVAPPVPSPTSETLLEAARSGSRLAVLIALRDEVAGKIAAGIAARELPTNARLLDELMREIEALERDDDPYDAALIPDEDFDPSMV